MSSRPLRPSSLSRRGFLGTLPVLPLAVRNIVVAETPGAAPAYDLDPGAAPLRIALIADCQYADVEPLKPATGRQYLRSPRKLADAVAAPSRLEPHAAIHLGDLIDRDFANIAVVKPIFDAFACPHFQVAGNHDYSVADADKPKVRAALGIPADGFDERTAPGWRFLFLESNEISLFRHPAIPPSRRHAGTGRCRSGIPAPVRLGDARQVRSDL